MKTPDIEKIREILNYDPKTGIFTWLDDRRKSVSIGSVAGHKDKQGYIQISIKSRPHRAHRLAFLFMTGEIPEYVDHINRVKDDNRWENLRSCTFSQNMCNRGIKRNNKTGVLGVTWCKSRSTWSVRVNYNKVRFERTFKDFELAELVASEARSKFHGDFKADNERSEKIAA